MNTRLLQSHPRAVLLPVLAALCGAVLTVAAFSQPLLLVAAAGAAIAAALIWRDVDVATWIVLFVVYSNAAVVAVRYHGVPPLAGHAVVGLLFIPLVYHAVLRRRGAVAGPSFLWIVAFAVVQLLGVLRSDRPETAWEEFNTFLQEGVLLYLLVVNTVRSERALRGATWALVLAGFLMGGVPLLQQVTGNFDNEYGGFAQTGGEPGFSTGEVTVAGEVVQQRLAGPIGEKNRYAQVMLMLLPLGLLRVCREQRTPLRLLALAGLLCATAGTLLAFSRSAIVAGGMVVVFAAWLGYISRTRVALVMVLGVAALLATPHYRTRMLSLLNLREMMVSGRHSSADGALKGRATEMGAAALLFLDYPVVGVGPGMFKFYSREYGERIGLRSLAPERQAHCLLLAVAAENGALGLLALLGVFFATGRGLHRAGHLAGVRPETRAAATALLMVLLVYFATGLFLHFAFIRYFWVVVALGDAAIVIARRQAALASQPGQSLGDHGMSPAAASLVPA